MTEDWRENLANAQSGNWLLTKFDVGYRLWRVLPNGRVGCFNDVLATDLPALFERLNATTDQDIEYALSESDENSDA